MCGLRCWLPGSVQIKLADKQAAVEKLQWEAMTSNKKVEKLQEELNAFQGERSSYTLLFEGLSDDHFTLSDEDYDVNLHGGHLPEIVSYARHLEHPHWFKLQNWFKI